MSAGEKTSPLQTIPLEVRWMIWDEVGEVEDFCSLIQTCKWIGAEILERIPVPGCKCKSRLHNHCPRPIIKLDHLAIIVDPYCSPGRSWLKFEATPPGSANRRRPPVVWTIRDLDSALTPDLACIQSRRITIEFRAPKRGYYFVFFLVLRAKLFDVCQIINRMDGSPLPAEQGRWQQQREEKEEEEGQQPPQQQYQQSLEIRFRDPWVEEDYSFSSSSSSSSARRGPNKAFWENRPCFVQRAGWGWLHRNGKFRRKTRKITGKRHQFPYFYECLMMPLLLHQIWRNASVFFDREPRRRNTSFKVRHWGLCYFGARALILATWDLCERDLANERVLAKDPVLDGNSPRKVAMLRRSYCITNTERDHRAEWERQKKVMGVDCAMAAYDRFLDRMTAISDNLHLLVDHVDYEVGIDMMGEGSPTYNLLSCLRRTYRHLSPSNSFSSEYRCPRRPWTHDDFICDASLIRSQYIEWALGGFNANYNCCWRAQYQNYSLLRIFRRNREFLE